MELDSSEPASSAKSLRALLSSGYETNASQYIQEGFRLFKLEAGLFVAFILLMFVAKIFIGMIPLLKGFSSALMAPVFAGAFLVAHKIKNGEQVALPDFLAPAQQQYMPLFLTALLPALLIAGITLLLGGWAYFKISILGIGPDFIANDFDDIMSMAKTMSAYTGRSSWIGVLSLVIYTFFLFGMLLVLFERFQPLRALDISRQIISKKFFNWMGFLILLGLINIAGAMCLGVGLLVSIPISICAIYAAYADVTGMDLED